MRWLGPHGQAVDHSVLYIKAGRREEIILKLG